MPPGGRDVPDELDQKIPPLRAELRPASGRVAVASTLRQQGADVHEHSSLCVQSHAQGGDVEPVCESSEPLRFQLSVEVVRLLVQ